MSILNSKYKKSPFKTYTKCAKCGRDAHLMTHHPMFGCMCGWTKMMDQYTIRKGRYVKTKDGAETMGETM